MAKLLEQMRTAWEEFHNHWRGNSANEYEIKYVAFLEEEIKVLESNCVELEALSEDMMRELRAFECNRNC